MAKNVRKGAQLIRESAEQGHPDASAVAEAFDDEASEGGLLALCFNENRYFSLNRKCNNKLRVSRLRFFEKCLVVEIKL